MKRNIMYMLVLFFFCITFFSAIASAEAGCGSDEPNKVSGVVETVYNSGDEVFVFFQYNDVCYEFKDTCMTHFKALEDSDEKDQRITVYYESVDGYNEIVIVHLEPMDTFSWVWVFLIGFVIGAFVIGFILAIG